MKLMKSGVKMTYKVKERRKKVISRLEKQLSLNKKQIQTGIDKGKYIILLESDIKRINKELQILKTRI